jgi:hypothetical protein
MGALRRKGKGLQRCAVRLLGSRERGLGFGGVGLDRGAG